MSVMFENTDDWVKEKIRGISHRSRVTFTAAAAAGILAHMYTSAEHLIGGGELFPAVVQRDDSDCFYGAGGMLCGEVSGYPPRYSVCADGECAGGISGIYLCHVFYVYGAVLCVCCFSDGLGIVSV